MGSQGLFSGEIPVVSRPSHRFFPLSGSPKGYDAILPVVINAKARKAFPFQREKEAPFQARTLSFLIEA
jgi:hypothetical protein